MSESMTVEQERADFETWISKPPFEYSTPRFGNGEYVYATVGFAWKAWQAAQAKMQARVAELEAEKWNAQIAEAALLSVEKERDKLAKRVEIRGDFCRTLEAAKQQVEDERDGLAAKCAELEYRINLPIMQILSAGQSIAESASSHVLVAITKAHGAGPDAMLEAAELACSDVSVNSTDYAQAIARIKADAVREFADQTGDHYVINMAIDYNKASQIEREGGA